MRNYFLATVGNVELFKTVNGELKHFASAKTLTDSAINLSVSGEEVRGGMGGQLLGQFFHTSSFGLSMTDTMFHLEYIAAQVGGEITKGGYGMVDEQITVAAGADGAVVVPALKELPIALLEGTNPIVWYNAPGDTEYATYEVKPNADGTYPTTVTLSIPGARAGDIYCVHYFANKASARKLIVNSNFVPEELVAFLTTRLYAGQKTSVETGKPVGSVTVKIPRFQLNGTMDIALAMASAATVQMQGTALSYDDSCEGGKYAEIVEFYEESVYDGYDRLVIADGTNEEGEIPQVYAVGSKKTPLLIDNAELTFIPELSANGTVVEPITNVILEYADSKGVEHRLVTGDIATALVSLYSGDVKLGDETYDFVNPGLVMSRAGDTVTLTGKIAKYEGDLSAWNFTPATSNIFALQLTVPNANEQTTITLVGTHHTKNITYADFDGKDYIYLVLDGNTKKYTLTVKANDSIEAYELTIVNEAEPVGADPIVGE